MGVLIQKRDKLASLSNLDPIEMYAVANLNNNFGPTDAQDSIDLPLREIRRRIAFGPPFSIRFTVDNS